MGSYSEYPERLRDLLSDIVGLDIESRMDLLIELAEKFVEVPDEIASQPYPEGNRVAGCESEAFIFTKQMGDATFKYYFAVENPLGVSAKALSVILDEGLSGASLSEISKVSPEFVYDVFGQTLTMGKGQGLMGMVGLAKKLAGDDE